MPAVRLPTNPAAVVEPTNADLAAELVALRVDFRTHADLDAAELTSLKSKTNWQTVIISAVVAAATIIGALAGHGG